MKRGEAGAKYLTSFISYLPNYILIFLVFLFLFLFFREFNLKITFQPKGLNDLISIFFVFGLLILISYLIEEPFFERVVRQYYITDSEVIKIEGIITKKRIAIPYPNIADIKVNQGVIARIFNYGDIIISGFKESIVMKGIKRPYSVYEQIKEKVSKEKLNSK
jgi:membrane protein YdbS with pleckstrin-like domain